ncbi:MAG: hypothetical protein IPI41_12115 [Flavobacteriales bacterium]|nr:hypothetical protein [Flavobacteriales bacterium]
MAIGSFTLEANTSGEFNTGLGHRAPNARSTTNSNTAVGHSALEVRPVRATYRHRAVMPGTGT